MGYELGLGGTTAVCKNLSLRGDVIFSGYGSSTVYAFSGPIQYRNHNINTMDGMLSLVYKFA